MRKMLLIAAAAALLAPAAALATKPPTKPSHPTQSQSGSHPAPQVLYILRGTVVAYTSATSANTPGWIQIDVTSANRHGKAFKDSTSPTAPLQLTVTTSTKIVLHKHLAIATGDRVIVKVRFHKKLVLPDDLTSFQQVPVQQIVDQGMHSNNGQGQSGPHASTFLYVVRGTLSASYAPGSPSITLTDTKVNHGGSVLKTTSPATLTLSVASSATFGSAKATWVTGDRVIVKAVGPKKLTAVTELSPAKQVIDQGQ